MAYLIENNAFTNDTKGVRATRLYFLSNSIDTYSAGLSVTGDVLTWAQGAAAAFDAAQVKQSAEIGEKEEAFQTSQEADLAMQERYQILKELLVARYGEADDKLKIYGIDGRNPRSRADMIDKAEALVEGNTRQLAATDPNALPQAMIDAFQLLIDDSKQKYYDAGIERSEALQASDELYALMDDDSIKLRGLYHWVVAYWGKYDPRLIELGFAQAQEHGGGYPDAPANLAWDVETDTFSWDEVESATSYQLVYKAPLAAEWEEVYNGVDLSAVFDPGPGQWEFKVRARNANGYGEFSEKITILVPGGIAPPTNVVLTYFPAPSNYLELTWDAVVGATGYKLYQSIVPVGQPSGVYTSPTMPVSSPYVVNEPTSGKRYYYKVAATAPGQMSEPSAEVFADVV